jgi:hypothetical protein
MHVIPGMDAAAADEIAMLILGETVPHVEAHDDSRQSGMDAILDAGSEK